MHAIKSSSIAFLTSALLVSACAEVGSGAGEDADETTVEDGYNRRNPVIIVHGCPPPPESANSDEFILTVPLVDYLLSHGYRSTKVYQWASDGALCGSTLTQATELAAFARNVRNATGASQVDIIAHSMGALTARNYAKAYPDRVDHLITIAGANHGSEIAGAGVDLQAAFGAPNYEGMKEMYPPYACKGETVQAADVQFALNGCLTPTGRSAWRDETPGWVDYLSIVNTEDEIIQPWQSACLNQGRENDCGSWVNEQVAVPGGECWFAPEEFCPGHGRVLWDPGVMAETVEFLRN